MQYSKLTEKIIGCAYKVYNTMGFGFLESVYEKCMLIELGKARLKTEAQKPVTVYYNSEIVGQYFVDLLVEKKIIIEIKSVRRIAKAHEIQLVNYLVATEKEIGLVINFGERKVQVKRKLRQLNCAP